MSVREALQLPEHAVLIRPSWRGGLENYTVERGTVADYVAGSAH